MLRPDDDELVTRIAETLRAPAVLSPGFERRVMDAVRGAPPSRIAAAWAWLREPRAFAASPLAGLAMAAMLGVLVVAGALVPWRGPAPVATAAFAATEPRPVAFVFLAPQATTVSLAGDFNGWDAGRTALARDPSGLWTVEVPLAPGRYQYAFVVDGRTFVPDPGAPRSVQDDFGTPSSVVTVAGAAPMAPGGAL